MFVELFGFSFFIHVSRLTSHVLTSHVSRTHVLTYSRSHALTLSRSHVLTLSRSHALTDAVLSTPSLNLYLESPPESSLGVMILH